MDAVKFLEELERMCDSFGGNCSEDCEIYKLRVQNKRTDIIANYIPACDFVVRRDPEECVSIVEKWSAEHPVKTRLMDFVEKFPNAHSEQVSHVYPRVFGYCGERKNCIGCDYHGSGECWHLPLEE